MIAGQEAEDQRKQEALGQRQGGAEEPRLRGGPVAQAGRPRGAEEARLLWQVRQDTQGRHQPQHTVRGLSGAGREFLNL